MTNILDPEFASFILLFVGANACLFASYYLHKSYREKSSAALAAYAVSFISVSLALYVWAAQIATGLTVRQINAWVVGGTNVSQVSNLLLTVILVILAIITGVVVVYINRALDQIGKSKADIVEERREIENTLSLPGAIKEHKKELRKADFQMKRLSAKLEALAEIAELSNFSADRNELVKMCVYLHETLALYDSEDAIEIKRMLSILKNGENLFDSIGDMAWLYIEVLPEHFPEDEDISLLVSALLLRRKQNTRLADTGRT